MELKPGIRIRSRVCESEAVIIRSPAGHIDLRCGGFAMSPLAAPSLGSTLDAAFQGGTVIGKRYVDDSDGLEVLVTKAGKGSLSLGAVALKEKPAKKLPSSD
jgi:hypothetical protein